MMERATAPGVDRDEMARDRFLAFYDLAVGPLFGYLYRASGGQRELAEDLCQDVFATALERARDGDTSVMTVPWAITVGRNRLIDQWRRSAREERRLRQLAAVRPATAAVGSAALARAMSTDYARLGIRVGFYHSDGSSPRCRFRRPAPALF